MTTLSNAWTQGAARRTEPKPGKPIVLLVDDETEIVASLTDQLRRDFELITAYSGAEAIEVLRSNDVAVVVSDQRMAGLTGVDVLAASRELRPNAVRILLTGYADLDAVIDAVNRGSIFFYATKPWEAQDLEMILMKAVEHHRLVAERDGLIAELRAANVDLERRVVERTRELAERNVELEKANTLIAELARRDPLTGAFNRRQLDEVLALEVGRAHRQRLPLSAIMIDLDHFKSVNDRFGHSVGDAVLVAMARSLPALCREYDVIARYGGEEFVVVLPGTTLECALDIAERFRRGIGQLVVEGYPEQITASFGVANLLEKEEAGALVARADAALYLAKSGGRNRVEQDPTPGGASR